MSTIIKDFGGNGGIFLSRGAHQGQCVNCGNYQYISRLAWTRRTRPTCKDCGGLLEPSKTAQKGNPRIRCQGESAPKRKCSLCGAILRSSNKEPWCSPCSPYVKRLGNYFSREIVEMRGTIDRTPNGTFFRGEYRLKRGRRQATSGIELRCPAR
jgi:hypothetical protein